MREPCFVLSDKPDDVVVQAVRGAKKPYRTQSIVVDYVVDYDGEGQSPKDP